MYKLTLLTIFFYTLGFSLNAQEFGGTPPSVKWKQINNEQVKVIFPSGLDQQAKRIADISHYLNANTRKTIGQGDRKINIVLQNQTTFSNGYVQLAPWRSEFFMTPLQNSLQLGSLRWDEQLALHEYRHVQQYMNYRKGLSKFAYFIAGEEGQAVANSAAVPDWFFEGDAVFQETLMSEQGRGRLPEFFNGYRSLWEAGKNYSYMTLRNGSYRHYVPDHYQLGYLLVAYGRKQYGNDIWQKVTGDAVRYKPLFYPFQGAFKKNTGVKYKDFTAMALEFYKEAATYKKQDDFEALTPQNPGFVKDYHYPYMIGRDSLLVLRRTGRDIQGWYLLSRGKEKKLWIKDLSNDDHYSYRNGQIVYTAYSPDARWSWRDYSNIRMLDIQTGERKTIGVKGKYFAPDLSNESTAIAAVEVSTTGSSAIHIIDPQSGKIFHAFRDSSLFFTYPRFSRDDKSIFSAARNREGQMSLVKINISSGVITPLLPFSYQAIAFPYVSGDSVYFTASRNGQDKLMLWDDAGAQLFVAGNRYTGIYQAVPSGDGRIIFSGFSAYGYRLYGFTPELNSMEISDWQAESNDLYLPETLDQRNEAGLSSVPSGVYEVEKYRKSGGLFNFHSWRPFYDQPDWSFSIYSDNVLNTFSSEIYYQYNENEKYSKFGYTGTYSALFPWITGGISYTFDRKAQVETDMVTWNELNANLGIRIPLDFSGGRTYKFLSFSSSFNTQQLYFTKSAAQKFQDATINFIDNSLSWNIQGQKALQQIYPRFAHTLFARYRGSVTEDESRQLLINTSIFLPGILKNHSFVVNAAYQSRDTANNYFYSNNFPLSRGYPGLNFPRMWKWGLNYQLPLFYPDRGFGQVVYFLRVRANLFYDNSTMKSLRTGTETVLRSVGTEIYFDTRWWNQQNVSFGFRYSRLLDADKYINPPSVNQWEFVLPVNLIPR
jgi:hypothetical protein